MTLTQVVEEYVIVKRSTGLRFRNGAMILRTFARRSEERRVGKECRL